jgi:hypothetical protein
MTDEERSTATLLTGYLNHTHAVDMALTDDSGPPLIRCTCGEMISADNVNEVIDLYADHRGPRMGGSHA